MEGGYAKAGDVLFCTDRDRLEAVANVRKDEVGILESMLERAKIKAETAELTFRQLERDYERERKLRDANVNSQASYEAAETAYRKATLDITDTKIDVIKTQARLQKARSNLDIALRDLERTMYKAPYDCVVTERFADPHEYVLPGRKILKIENHDRLQVVCNLESSQYDKVAVGRTRAEIFVNGQSACSGIVTYKAPSIEPETQTFKLKIAIPKNTSVICGSPCDVKLILLEKEAWGIPGSALMAGRAGRHRHRGRRFHGSRQHAGSQGRRLRHLRAGRPGGRHDDRRSAVVVKTITYSHQGEDNEKFPVGNQHVHGMHGARRTHAFRL